MAAVVTALLLLGSPLPSVALRVWVPPGRQVALLFQPVRLPCSYETTAPDPPPLVTWKFLAPCAGEGGAWEGGGVAGGGACPGGGARQERIVATKQGAALSVGERYRERGVSIEGGAELVLGPALWGDSGSYVCTVSSLWDLEGNNEAVAELLVLGWLFVVLVLLGAILVLLGLGLCWCQCCPHTCCCLLRCPCCPQRCCCPEALYLAGKAATSRGGGSVPYGPPPASIALHSLGSSHSSQVPLLRDSDGSIVAGPPQPLLTYLEAQISSMEPHGHYPPLKAAPPLSDVSSLHEPLPSYLPASRGRWRSAEVLGWGGGEEEEEEEEPPPPSSRPRSRSRDDVLRGVETPPSRRSRGGDPPRRLRKDALSRESLVV